MLHILRDRRLGVTELHFSRTLTEAHPTHGVEHRAPRLVHRLEVSARPLAESAVGRVALRVRDCVSSRHWLQIGASRGPFVEHQRKQPELVEPLRAEAYVVLEARGGRGERNNAAASRKARAP
jgi:hypothetical protein